MRDGGFRSDRDLELSRDNIERLATFNAEKARGILHADSYVEWMAELQRRFDHARRPSAPRRRWWS